METCELSNLMLENVHKKIGQVVCAYPLLIYLIFRVYERDPKTKKTKTLQMMRMKDIAAGTHHAGMVDEMGRVFTWGAGIVIIY